MRPVIATFKFTLFALVSLITTPMQLTLMRFYKGKGLYCLPMLWHKIICHIFRIKVTIHGKQHKDTQTIFISNHISYLDIPVIGSTIQASFVAKKDVASWPVFGLLSKLQQTAFISRDRGDAAQGKNTLDTMLHEGKNLIIFPEGTSTDGQSVKDFKSSLFAVTMQESLSHIKIQPITIKVISADKKAITTQKERDLYAWHLDMETPLAPHLWLFARHRGAEISMTFHEPISPQNFSDRKTLAKTCQLTVSNGLSTPNESTKERMTPQ
tara:strand:+ start:183 stop:986 length:804 start_codon:yes stop_codon:yes gene_type:complete